MKQESIAAGKWQEKWIDQIKSVIAFQDRFRAAMLPNINLKELMKLVELDQIKYELTDKAQNLKELGESL